MYLHNRRKTAAFTIVFAILFTFLIPSALLDTRAEDPPTSETYYAVVTDKSGNMIKDFTALVTKNSGSYSIDFSAKNSSSIPSYPETKADETNGVVFAFTVGSTLRMQGRTGVLEANGSPSGNISLSSLGGAATIDVYAFSAREALKATEGTDNEKIEAYVHTDSSLNQNKMLGYKSTGWTYLDSRICSIQITEKAPTYPITNGDSIGQNNLINNSLADVVRKSFLSSSAATTYSTLVLKGDTSKTSNDVNFIANALTSDINLPNASTTLFNNHTAKYVVTAKDQTTALGASAKLVFNQEAGTYTITFPDLAISESVQFVDIYAAVDDLDPAENNGYSSVENPSTTEKNAKFKKLAPDVAQNKPVPTEAVDFTPGTSAVFKDGNLDSTAVTGKDGTSAYKKIGTVEVGKTIKALPTVTYGEYIRDFGDETPDFTYYRARPLTQEEKDKKLKDGYDVIKILNTDKFAVGSKLEIYRDSEYLTAGGINAVDSTGKIVKPLVTITIKADTRYYSVKKGVLGEIKTETDDTDPDNPIVTQTEDSTSFRYRTTVEGSTKEYTGLSQTIRIYEQDDYGLRSKQFESSFTETDSDGNPGETFSAIYENNVGTAADYFIIPLELIKHNDYLKSTVINIYNSSDEAAKVISKYTVTGKESADVVISVKAKTVSDEVDSEIFISVLEKSHINSEKTAFATQKIPYTTMADVFVLKDGSPANESNMIVTNAVGQPTTKSAKAKLTALKNAKSGATIAFPGVRTDTTVDPKNKKTLQYGVTIAIYESDPRSGVKAVATSKLKNNAAAVKVGYSKYDPKALPADKQEIVFAMPSGTNVKVNGGIAYVVITQTKNGKQSLLSSIPYKIEFGQSLNPADNFVVPQPLQAVLTSAGSTLSAPGEIGLKLDKNSENELVATLTFPSDRSIQPVGTIYDIMCGDVRMGSVTSLYDNTASTVLKNIPFDAVTKGFYIRYYNSTTGLYSMPIEFDLSSISTISTLFTNDTKHIKVIDPSKLRIIGSGKTGDQVFLFDSTIGFYIVDAAGDNVVTLYYNENEALGSTIPSGALQRSVTYGDKLVVEGTVDIPGGSSIIFTQEIVLDGTNFHLD